MDGRNFFVTINGSTQASIREASYASSVPNFMRKMDGVERWGISLEVFPEGVDAYNSRGSFKCDTFIQAGGSATAMVVQLLRSLPGGYSQMSNLAHAPVDLSTPATERIIHGKTWTMVYPQEVWTAEEAIPVFRSFYDNLEIPSGIYERPFESSPGNETGLIEELSGE